jgi:hypothetical protein
LPAYKILSLGIFWNPLSLLENFETVINTETDRKLTLSDPWMRTVHDHADVTFKACADERAK